MRDTNKKTFKTLQVFATFDDNTKPLGNNLKFYGDLIHVAHHQQQCHLAHRSAQR